MGIVIVNGWITIESPYAVSEIQRLGNTNGYES